VRVSAFQNASNKEVYEVKKNGELFNLTAAGVTRILIIVNGQSISSDTNAISYSGSSLEVEWGALNINSGAFTPIIYAYKDDDQKGEVLFGPTKSSIYLQVISDERT
jgi:hypothetical protein